MLNQTEIDLISLFHFENCYIYLIIVGHGTYIIQANIKLRGTEKTTIKSYNFRDEFTEYLMLSYLRILIVI